jgi:transposase-like protein
MPRSGLTWQEKYEHVLAYVSCPYGGKGAYLREHGLSFRSMSAWRAAVYAGTLDQGLVPRVVLSTVEENQEVARLARANEELRALLAAQDQSHTAALAAKDAQLAAASRTVDALGKAIALLHPGNESVHDITGR